MELGHSHVVENFLGNMLIPVLGRGLAALFTLLMHDLMPKAKPPCTIIKEIDVISVMIEGRIDHQGSLANGQGLETGDVQVQRAGGEGFSHNEVNPDDAKNRMLQLWVLPEQKGTRAAYKLYKPLVGKVTRIYGGSHAQNDTFPSRTVIDMVSLNPAQAYVLEKPFLAYQTVGKGTANHQDVAEGDLCKSDQLRFTAKSAVKMIVIYEN